MARWRLRNAHYLNVERDVNGQEIEWEYKETNRETGRQQRKVFPVPLHLNPEDPADWNYPQDQVIIVAQGKGAMPKDIIFIGPPTPEMEPLDEEAEKISEAESHKWKHPIDALPGQGFSQSLLEDLQKQLAAAMAGAAARPAAPVPLNGVDPEAFAKLQEQVAQLAEQNAQLQAQLLEKPQTERRA